MTTIINGSSPSITFSDSTTQSSGVNTVNPVFTGDASISGLTVGKGGGAVVGNTAIGQNVLANNTGSQNTAVGFNAMTTNTSGIQNTASGQGALNNNTTGGQNAAFGYVALFSNTSAVHNSAFGSQALTSNTTGTANTSVGYQSLLSNTTASNNTAVGFQAGYSVVSGSYNTFIGNQAGYLAAPTGTALNVAVGHQAGYNLTGTSNTLLGNGSGSAITSGTKNSVLGSYNGNQDGLDIRTANNHIVLSDGDGAARAYWSQVGMGFTRSDFGGNFIWNVQQTNTTGGGYPLILEYTAQTPNDTTSRFLTCRDPGVPSTGRMFIFSNGNVVNTNNSYGALSDVKLKENIVDSNSQWNDIKAVRVRKYSMKADNLSAPNMIGVVAQELEEAGMSGLVFESPDTDENNNPIGTATKQVNYSILYMKAVKALQEAMERIETLEAKVNALENK